MNDNDLKMVTPKQRLVITTAVAVLLMFASACLGKPDLIVLMLFSSFSGFVMYLICRGYKGIYLGLIVTSITSILSSHIYGVDAAWSAHTVVTSGILYLVFTDLHRFVYSDYYEHEQGTRREGQEA